MQGLLFFAGILSGAMPVEDPAKVARDKRLDQLGQALEAFFKKETRRIDVEEAILRDVLKARGGAQKLAKANASASKLLLINDITTFLAG